MKRGDRSILYVKHDHAFLLALNCTGAALLVMQYPIRRSCEDGRNNMALAVVTVVMWVLQNGIWT